MSGVAMVAPKDNIVFSVSVSVPQSPAGPSGEGLDEELGSGRGGGSTPAAVSGVQPGAEEGNAQLDPPAAHGFGSTPSDAGRA